MNLRSDTASKIAYALALQKATGWKDSQAQITQRLPYLSPADWAYANWESFLLEANSLLPDPMQHVPNCCPCCGEAGTHRMAPDTDLRCTNPHCDVRTYRQTPPK